MNIIIPMAGMGTRMRPHTLTVPKPLIPVAGKPIVHRLVEDIAGVCKETINEIAFIVHPSFGKETENALIEMAQKLGAKGSICYQTEALGTAHAVYCAAEALEGNIIIAFADTLFIADFTLDTSKDAIIWVQKVPDPSAFGVVSINKEGLIKDFIEKPQTFVSDLAIIGIYYFKEGEKLREELKFLIDNNVHVNGEYQLTTALENMKNKNIRFSPEQIKEWLDCGNKQATVHTNKTLLSYYGSRIHKNCELDNSHIIEPCFIGEGVILKNSIVGPHASIGKNTSIENSVISNSIIQSNAIIQNLVINESMIGNHTTITKKSSDLNIGDYSHIQE